MYPSTSPLRLLGWTLLSQTIWLPLVGIELHDRFQARVKELAPLREQRPPDPAAEGSVAQRQLPDPLSESLAAALQAPTTGYLLGGSGRGRPGSPQPPAAPADTAAPRSFSLAAPIQPRPLAPETLQALRREAPPSLSGRSGPVSSPEGLRESRPDPLTFRRSDLLGGPVSLSDLDAPLIPPLAAAERARLSAGGDPLSPLPTAWRAPMREALRQLPRSAATITPARVVHVPSRRVSRSTPVPLALQSDGSVDVLSRPENPEVLEEIETWSRRQKPPQAGSVSPAVIHLQPLEQEPRPTAVKKPPVQRLTPPTPSAPAAPAAAPPSAAAPIQQPAPPPAAAVTSARPSPAQVVPAPADSVAPPEPAAPPADD